MVIPQFDCYDAHDRIYPNYGGDDFTWLCRPPVNIAMEATLQKRSLVSSKIKTSQTREFNLMSPFKSEDLNSHCIRKNLKDNL